MRIGRPLAVLLLLALAEAHPARNMVYEAGEEYTGGRELLQRTCVPEALLGEERGICVFVARSELSGPSMRILDAFLFTPVVGADTQRVTGGALPPITPPGLSTFYSWYGYWYDLNKDGYLGTPSRSLAPDPNEWVPIPNSKLYGFLEPGPHPPPTTLERPEEDTPDFSYTAGSSWYQSEASIPFLDGSLLRPLTLRTVQDPLLVPSADLPFTPGPDSLYDEDLFASVLPDPLESIYRSILEPLIDPISTPGLHLLPRYTLPIPSKDTPLSGSEVGNEGDRLQGEVFAPYGREYLPGSNSSDENYSSLGAYNVSWAPWVDLLLQTTRLATGNGASSAQGGDRTPLLKNSRGEPSLPPAFLLTFEVFVGAWRDLNGDGFVGRVRSPQDPYEGGARPLPDRYFSSAGEFVPGEVVYVPGRGTVDPSGNIVPYVVPDSGTSALLFSNPSALRKGPGWYYATTSWIAPAGSALGGFTVCVGPFLVHVKTPDGDLSEDLYDCDRVERWS